MPTFEWKGRGRTGEQTGVLVADSKDAVVNALRRQQIVVTAVKEKGKELAVPKFGGRVPPQLVAIFTRQFSVMIDAGLPLVQCLEILGGQQENKTMKRALIQIRQDVESGSNLADSMRKHPKIFNDLFTNMVAAGEAGGILDTILQRLAQYIEKSVKLNSQVKSAMIYPVAVIFIADFWWLIGILIFGTVYALRRYHETYKGKRVLDGFLLRLQVLGLLLRK